MTDGLNLGAISLSNINNRLGLLNAEICTVVDPTATIWPARMMRLAVAMIPIVNHHENIEPIPVINELGTLEALFSIDGLLSVYSAIYGKRQYAGLQVSLEGYMSFIPKLTELYSSDEGRPCRIIGYAFKTPQDEAICKDVHSYIVMQLARTSSEPLAA